MAHSILDRISLSFRCPREWEELEGDAAVRFCGHCQKHVHDLASLTATEVAEFVQRQPLACVRITRAADGSLVTKGCPRERNRRGVLTAAVVAGSAALAACAQPGLARNEPGAGGGEGTRGAQEYPLMGVICPPDWEK